VIHTGKEYSITLGKIKCSYSVGREKILKECSNIQTSVQIFKQSSYCSISESNVLNQEK
jgi:hypothetical protein